MRGTVFVAVVAAFLAFSQNASAAKYKRIEILNALYSGNTAAIMPRSSAEEAAMTGYILSLLEVTGKSCSTHSAEAQNMLLLLNVLSAFAGGFNHLASAMDGESDAKALIADYGCESNQVKTILTRINSFNWIRS